MVMIITLNRYHKMVFVGIVLVNVFIVLQFVGTMTKILEVASEWSVPVIVLDRPNPLRGDRIDGPVIRPRFQSLEGYHLIPIRHGMTIGELAIMANEMGWIKDLKRANLTVIPMANWKRSYWKDTVSYTHLTLPTNREV